MNTRHSATVVVAALAFWIPGTASAGSFDVRSCGASASNKSQAWITEARSGDQILDGDSCGIGGSSDSWVDYRDSRWTRTFDGGASVLVANPGVVAALRFDAPPGGMLTSIRYRRQLYSSDEYWGVRARSAAGLIEQCTININHQDCDDLGDGSVLKTYGLSGAAWLAVELVCLGSPCLYGVGATSPSPSQPTAAAVIYSSVVTVEENIAPTAGSLTVNGTNAAGWLTAGATGSLSGSDTLGLRRLEVVDASNGDAVVGSVANTGCVDWSVLPCSEPSAGLGPGFSGSVAIGALPEGAHQLKARAVDAAGNLAVSGPVAVKVDRTAPVAIPTTTSAPISGTTAPFTWGAPAAPQTAPITGGRLKICTGPSAASLSCSWRNAIGPTGSESVPLGNDGDLTTVQVELTDEAGNVGLSSTVELRRDTTAPAAPVLSVTPGSGDRMVISVDTRDSDVADYALRYCGPSGCTDSRRRPFGFVDVDAPAPGPYRAEIALVDHAGNVGPTAVASFDRPAATPPPRTDPPPTTPPITRTPIKLTVAKPIRPSIKRLSLRGTTQPGSTSRVTVSITGRPAGKSRSVTKRTSVKPKANGTWKLSAVLPARVPRGRKYTIRITAKPTDRFTAATATYTRRR